MSASVASAEREAIVGYFVDNWKRSSLAALEKPVDVVDPGHGNDEVCPIIYRGQAMNPSSDEEVGAVSPFTARDLIGFEDDGELRPGVGWLVVELGLGAERVRIPGNPPTRVSDLVLTVWIASPGQDGPALADAYAGAIAGLLEHQFFAVTHPSLEEIRQTGDLPQRAAHLGIDDAGWSWSELKIPFKSTWKGSARTT